MFNRPLSRMPTSSLAHNDGWRWLDTGQLLPLPIYWPLTAPINRLLCLLGSWSTRLLNNVMTPFIIPTPHILECQQDNQLDSAQDTVIHIFSIRKQGYCYLTSGDGVCEKRHNISGSNGRKEELSIIWNIKDFVYRTNSMWTRETMIFVEVVDARVWSILALAL